MESSSLLRTSIQDGFCPCECSRMALHATIDLSMIKGLQSFPTSPTHPFNVKIRYRFMVPGCCSFLYMPVCRWSFVLGRIIISFVTASTASCSSKLSRKFSYVVSPNQCFWKSCQYGERCKFLHPTEQQSRSNAFGFGMHSGSTQQQKPNPFGFGVQSSSQPRAVADFAMKHNQFKPFENKWTRFSPISSASATSSDHSDNHIQAGNHKCTDPESCKRVIVEDFEHERPSWKLTCYGHCKYAPCDISGDISYEELRAAAYDDAKRGLSLQSIVERERNALNFKLTEFENLLRRPYVAPPSSTAGQSTPLGFGANTFSLSAQNTGQSVASSFSVLNASSGAGGLSPYVPSNTASRSLNSSSTLQQTADAFGQSFLPSGVSQQMSNSTNNNFNIVVGQKAVDGQEKNIEHQSGHEPIDASVWLKEKWNRGEIPEEAPPDTFI